MPWSCERQASRLPHHDNRHTHSKHSFSLLPCRANHRLVWKGLVCLWWCDISGMTQSCTLPPWCQEGASGGEMSMWVWGLQGGYFVAWTKSLVLWQQKNRETKKWALLIVSIKFRYIYFSHDCYELHLQYMVHNVLDIQYTCSIWMLIYRTLAKYAYPIILQPFHSSPPTRRWRDTTPSSTEVSLHVQVPSRCEPQLGTCTVGNSHRGQLQSQKESNPFREPKLV